MDALQALTSALRNLRVKNGVEERAAVHAHVRLPDARLVEVLNEAKPWFERLARCTLAGFSTAEKRPAEADADVVAMAPFGAAELYLPLGGLVDKGARKKDLAAKIEKLKQQTGAIDAKLGNEGFVRARAGRRRGARARTAGAAEGRGGEARGRAGGARRLSVLILNFASEFGAPFAHAFVGPPHRLPSKLKSATLLGLHEARLRLPLRTFGSGH